MGKNKTSKANSILKNPYAIMSVLTAMISVVSYWLKGVFDRAFLLSPDANKINLIVVAVVAAIAAIIKVPRRKGVFIFFLLLSLIICAISLMGASFIGAVTF